MAQHGHYRLRFFIPYLLFSMLIAALLLLFFYWVQVGLLQHDNQKISNTYSEALEGGVGKEAAMLEGYLEFVKNSTSIQNLYKSGSREALFEEIRPIYQKLHEKIDLTHFYFIGLDGTIFLRGHEPTRHSDKADRYTWHQANRTGAPSFGLEFGIKKNFTLRVVHPWIVDGDLIGYIELGKEIDTMMGGLAHMLGFEIFMAVDKKLYAGSIDVAMARTTFAHQTRDFYLVYGTRKVPEALDELLDNPHQEGMGFTMSDRYYLAQAKVANDVSGAPVGYFVVMRDATLQYDALWHGIYSFAGLLAGIFLFLTLGVYFFASKKEREIDELAHKLAGQQELLSQLIVGSPIPIVYKDNHKIYRIASQSFLDLFGLASQEELASRTLFDVAPIDLAKALDTIDDSLLQGKEKKISFEYIWPLDSLQKGKTSIFYKSVFYSKEGKPAGVLGFVFDISEQKRFENMLQEFNDKLMVRVEKEVGVRMAVEHEKQMQDAMLLQQSKMAAMGEMIASIAHQWKQPLNVVALLTDDIADAYTYGEVDAAAMATFKEKMLFQVDFMSQTINDFRGFFQPTKTQELLFACEYAQKVLTLIGKEFEGNRITTLFHDHEHFKVLGQPNEFKHVILNILSNAKDVFKTKKMEGRIEFFFEIKGDEGFIVIQDNGGGIPPELLPDKLFEPYKTTKGDEGTGLGLYIAKLIVEKNSGGRIHVANVGEGARFTITLPIARD